MTTNVTVTDLEGIVVAGGEHRFLNRITRDGEEYNLAGKTVTATVRYEGDPHDPIASGLVTLEDIAVDVLDPVEVDADGVECNVAWLLTAEMSALLLPMTPSRPPAVSWFTIQYWVDGDDFYPDLARFKVRRPGGGGGG